MHSDFLISVAADTSSATPPLLNGFPAMRAFITFMALGAAFMALTAAFIAFIAFISLAAAFIAFISRTMMQRGDYK